jgi:hypothetical protein
MGNLNVSVFLFLSLLFLAACQDKSAREKAAEKAVGQVMKETTGKEASVDIQGEKIRIQTKDGTGEINVTNTWPEDMPGDVPRFTLGKIKGVNKSNVEGKKSWNVVIDETQEGAFPKYVEELKTKGWKIDLNLAMGKGGSVTASKTNHSLMVIFNNDQKTGTITVSQNP